MVVNRIQLEKDWKANESAICASAEVAINEYLRKNFSPGCELISIPLNKQLSDESKKYLIEHYLKNGWKLRFNSAFGNNETNYYVEVTAF